MTVFTDHSFRQVHNGCADIHRWLLVIVLLLLTGLPLDVFPADSIDELRVRQQNALKVLESNYHSRVRNNPDLIKADGTVDTSHPDYQKALSDYTRDKSEIQSQFNGLDSRGQDLEDLQRRYGSQIKTTGSSPKDVRADVDITASDRDIAAQIADEWRARGDDVDYDEDLGIYINKSKDTTLWQPPSDKQLAERQKYHDAFSTPGGKQATDVKGAESIRDPEGYVLDNEKKFIHGAEDFENTDINNRSPEAQLKRDMALKTMGKSVSKTADEVGHDSEVINQARKLRNYGDKFETGITPLGATPEQQKADEKKWIQQADQEVQNTKPVAAKKSQKIREVREALAKTAEKNAKGRADPNAEDTAKNIRGRNKTLDEANEKARSANTDARKRAGLPKQPEPDEMAIGSQAKNRANRAAERQQEQQRNAVARERRGEAKNSKWKVTDEREGNRNTKTITSKTRDADGSETTRTSRTENKRTPGGGKTTQQNRKIIEKGADGTTRSTRQNSTGYEGKKTSSSTAKTSEVDRDASGQVTRRSDSTKTTNSRTDKSGKRTSTNEQSTTHQSKNSWLPGGGGTTTTKRNSHTIEEEQDGHKRTTQTGRSTTTDNRTGIKTTTTSQSSSTTSTDDDGRKTTTNVTTTTTDKPWSKSRTTQGVYESDLKPGGDPNEPKDGERVGDPTKVNVKIAGGKLFDPVDEAKKTAATSTAGRTDSGVEYGGDAKVQLGQYGSTGNWEVTANKRGLHAKVDVNAEVNAIKATATGSAEKKIGKATVGGKISTTAKVGAEGKGTAEAHLGSDRIAGSAEAKVFIGGKAEAAAEASLSLWGIKLTGKAQGEVSAGAGAEAKVDAELSWTKIRLGAKVAATLGLGAGGGTSVEFDATEAITGYDPAALDQQFQAGDSIVRICRDLRSGRLRLPPGVKFSDIRDRLQKNAELFAKHPQLTKDGKKISLVDSLIQDLNLKKGKNNTYITAHHKQKDWYCTNRPQIEAPVVLPSIVERK
ncbi:MAG: hypothetical protein OQL28_02760 [Sedimenticola sp.]|nr:hypothetical protein [Sedimenticola sp.]